jgi:hypothetical protein
VFANLNLTSGILEKSDIISCIDPQLVFEKNGIEQYELLDGWNGLGFDEAPTAFSDDQTQWTVGYP